MTIKDFRDLNIWKKGTQIVKEIYGLTSNFLKEELYGLAGQLKRASVSIPSNIAEGFARSSHREYKQFLFVSLGSCAEVRTQIIIASELGFFEKVKADKILEELSIISKMIMTLIKKIQATSDKRPATDD